MYAGYRDRNKAGTTCSAGYDCVDTACRSRAGTRDLPTMSPEVNTSDEMSPDLVFEILSNTRRRMVLYYLRWYGGSVSVQELVGEVAALQNDIAVEDLTRQQRKRVYVSLYQTHLPKLEEAGLIEYDDDEGIVRLTDSAGDIDTYLTPTTGPARRWQLPYIWLSLVGGLLFVLIVIDVPVVASIPTAGLGLALMIGFALLTALQYRRHRKEQQEIPDELLRHGP